MKFKRIREPGNRTGYEAELSEYDSVPPSLKLLVDELPEGIDPNREAVALYLVFRNWCGGEFTVPRWMSPHTGEVIAADASPVRLSPAPFEFYPKGLPIGTRIVECHDSMSGLKEDTIAVLPAHSWSGAIRGYNSVAVSSNAFVFRQDDQDIAPLIGIAVLFADNLNADTIRVRGDIGADREREIASLLSSVRLGFEVEQ